MRHRGYSERVTEVRFTLTTPENPVITPHGKLLCERNVFVLSKRDIDPRNE